MSATTFEIRTVEDILEAAMLAFYDREMQILLQDQWLGKFLPSVHDWACIKKRPLTTDQAAVILRVFRRFRHILIRRRYTTHEAADQLIAFPRYAQPPKPSLRVAREVRYIGGNTLAFRFKLNDDIVQFIKLQIAPGHLVPDAPVAIYDRISRLWLVSVTRSTVEPIMELIAKFGFGTDQHVEQYLADAFNAVTEPSNIRFDGARFIVEVNDNEVVGGWVENVLGGQVI